jgi:hypothetical protein
MKYNVKFIGQVEGRDAITHGGVSFPVGKAFEVDSDKSAMSPWFVGNPSFEVEEIENESTETESEHRDAAEIDADSDGSQGADQDGQGTENAQDTVEVKSVAKRVRKKPAAK